MAWGKRQMALKRSIQLKFTDGNMNYCDLILLKILKHYNHQELIFLTHSTQSSIIDNRDIEEIPPPLPSSPQF